MKRILVAYDGSAGAQLAVQAILSCGLPERAEAKVLTIADVWLPPKPSEVCYLSENSRPVVAYEHACAVLRDAQKTATAGAGLLREICPGWTISDKAEAGSPASCIVQEAKRWRAELIIMSSHGRTRFEEFFLGSVSLQVATKAACSVRIVRSNPQWRDGPPRLLIGLDGSEDALRAGDEVASRSWRDQTEVQLVTVIDPRLRSRVLASMDTFEVAETRDGAEAWMEPSFKALREKFATRDMKVTCHIFEGDPKHTLLKHAKESGVDAIFLGAHGIDHGGERTLGTVASATCLRAHCTVEIVRTT